LPFYPGCLFTLVAFLPWLPFYPEPAKSLGPAQTFCLFTLVAFLPWGLDPRVSVPQNGSCVR